MLEHPLRRLRVRAGLSQEALAERAGVGVATISALEDGRRVGRIGIAIDIPQP